MSVEGMWKFQSSSVFEPEVRRWGGIVVLETGRVMGGDSMMAYHGTYEVNHGGVIVAKVRSWTWNHDMGEHTNVFGMEGPVDYEVMLEGQHKDGQIVGRLYSEAMPDVELTIQMEKIADLPG